MDKNTLRAIALVRAYVASNYRANKKDVPEYQVKLVWYCKTLQNWKALLITDLEDKSYYELTYDGDKNQVYFDAYINVDNVVIQEPEHDRT